MDGLAEVMIGQKLEHTTFVSKELNVEEYNVMVYFLEKTRHVFAWKVDQMPGIDPRVACHKLNVNPNTKLVRQKPCHPQ